jgi:hypothetical protein
MITCKRKLLYSLGVFWRFIHFDWLSIRHSCPVLPVCSFLFRCKTNTFDVNKKYYWQQLLLSKYYWQHINLNILLTAYLSERIIDNILIWK